MQVGRLAELRVDLLWGKAPAVGSITAMVADGLRDRGARIRQVLPHTNHERSWVAALRSCHVVVHRGVRLDALQRAQRDAGTAPSVWCNALAAVRAVADRWTVHEALSAAGVPVPAAERHATWGGVLERHAPPCVVKRVDAVVGRSAGVHLQRDGALPAVAPFDGPYVAQGLVPGDGLDRTCYVAGERVFVAHKRIDPHTGRSRLVDVVPAACEQRRLALAVGAAFGLDVYGLDAIDGPEGWVVVDVNAFPGGRGVPGFAGAVVEHVLERARAGASRTRHGPSR